MPSSVIRFYSYSPKKRALTIVFQTGRRYVYTDVPPQTYDAMNMAPSKGEFFNAHIRDRFAFDRQIDVRSRS